jgi:hypothetical protein
MLVLNERLDGYDTFLTGSLEVDGQELPVRILTLDDVTVLRLVGDRPWAPPPQWTGTLHLSHGARTLSPPDDLTALARARRRDLTTLDDAELRYALTFLAEATTASIRAGRAAVIVDALPALSDDGSASAP